MKWRKLKRIFKGVKATWYRHDGFTTAFLYQHSRYFSVWVYHPQGRFEIKEKDSSFVYRNKNKQKCLNWAMEWQKKNRCVKTVHD